MGDNPIQPPTVEEVAEQLRDPAAILANALHRIHEADALIGGVDDMDTGDLALYKVATGFVLDRIARTASALAEAEQRHTLRAIDGFLDDPEGQQAYPAPADGYEPRPTNGVRFTATLAGAYLGSVGGRDWLHLAGHGFVDVTGASSTRIQPESKWLEVALSGRVVSATPDEALCVTDGGIGTCLPRALIVESPDE